MTFQRATLSPSISQGELGQPLCIVRTHMLALRTVTTTSTAKKVCVRHLPCPDTKK
jgi:hypothetical protein